MCKVIPLRNATQKLRLGCPVCKGEWQVFKGHEAEMICDECFTNDGRYQPLDVVGVVPEDEWRK